VKSVNVKKRASSVSRVIVSKVVICVAKVSKPKRPHDSGQRGWTDRVNRRDTSHHHTPLPVLRLYINISAVLYPHLRYDAPLFFHSSDAFNQLVPHAESNSATRLPCQATSLAVPQCIPRARNTTFSSIYIHGYRDISTVRWQGLEHYA